MDASTLVKRPQDSTSDSAAHKRRLSAISAAASGEIMYRILCPAERTGSVIGKGGSIISKVREDTRSKIRIEDPVTGSDDRVIVITADSASKGDHADASLTQAALIRVFERIEASDDGKDKAVNSTADCRLLVAGSQIGCVLGKGGKIIERIRGESGAQIKILGKELPQCSATGDVMIHISGSFSAVRIALFSVSSCLQDNVRTEPPSSGSAELFGSSLRGSSHPALTDPYSQRSFLPSLSGPDYHSWTYSSNPGMDISTSSHRKILEENVVFRMLCSNDRVGCIIGKAGAVIRALQSETGASIRVVDAVSDSDERIIAISARETAEMKSSAAQDAVLRVHSRFAEGVDKASPVPARLLVPAQQIGCLLGKGGSIIAEMRRTTGANIRIYSKEHVPRCAQPNDEVVQVTGSIQSVQDALLHITGRIRETIFPHKQYASAGMTRYVSAGPESPSMLRSRNESIHGLSHGINTIDRQHSLSHAVDRLGLERAPFSYGSETAGLQPFDHASSPRTWGPQVGITGNVRALPDAGTGLGSRRGSSGSATHTPVVTNTIVKVVIPQHFLGFVHGENDSNLAQIREISGAQVTIYDQKRGATEGSVVISGTVDQTRTAQSLVHGFILHGQSTT